MNMYVFSYREGRANTEVKGSYQGVGDIMLKNVQHLKVYNKYLEKLEEILNQVENLVRKNKSFETFYREFEVQKVCYLPFNTFLLKPLQRLLHYQLILDSKLYTYWYVMNMHEIDEWLIWDVQLFSWSL